MRDVRASASRCDRDWRRRPGGRGKLPGTQPRGGDRVPERAPRGDRRARPTLAHPPAQAARGRQAARRADRRVDGPAQGRLRAGRGHRGHVRSYGRAGGRAGVERIHPAWSAPMRSFRVSLGTNSHPVHVGSGVLERLGALASDAGLKPGRAAVISDANVAALYAAPALASLKGAGFDAHLIEIPAGESSKSIEMLETVYDRMAAAELDRHSVVVALGG